MLRIREAASLSLLRNYWPLYGLVFLIGTENFIISPFIPAMARDVGASVASLATMVTAYAITYAVTAPFLGNISDRLGRGPLVLLGTLVFMAGNLWVAAASSLVLLQAARALTGLGGAMAGPAIWAFLADTTAPQLRGRAMGLGMGAFSLGQIVGIPVGASIAGMASWRWTFGGIGLLMVPLLLVIAMLFKAKRKAGPRRLAAASMMLVFTIWRQSAVRLVFLITFLFHAGNLASYTFLGVILVSHYQLSTTQIGMTGILVGGGSLLGSLMGGKINDHWRSRGRSGVNLVAAWSLLLGVTVLITTSPVPLAVALVTLVLWFVASGAFVTTQQTLLTLVAPTMSATAVSWNNSIMHAGAGAGVWVLGVGLERDLPIGVMGAALALAAAGIAAGITWMKLIAPQEKTA